MCCAANPVGTAELPGTPFRLSLALSVLWGLIPGFPSFAPGFTGRRHLAEPYRNEVSLQVSGPRGLGPVGLQGGDETAIGSHHQPLFPQSYSTTQGV